MWQLTAANTTARLGDVNLTGNTFTATLPPQSITLFVIGATTGNQRPAAVASAAPTSGTAPLAVAFNGAGSSDPDGAVTSYAWNFGDGATGTGAGANHTYTTPGTYTARLTVTDNQGASSSTTLTISVNTNTPAAPSNLTASAVSAGQINLAWVDNAGNEDGFRIERCTGSGCTNFAQLATVAANVRSYADTGLSRNTNYTYRVRAYNSSGSSAYSNAVVTKTQKR
jgi:PKD repeat protein